MFGIQDIKVQSMTTGTPLRFIKFLRGQMDAYYFDGLRRLANQQGLPATLKKDDVTWISNDSYQDGWNGVKTPLVKTDYSPIIQLASFLKIRNTFLFSASFTPLFPLIISPYLPEWTKMLLLSRIETRQLARSMSGCTVPIRENRISGGSKQHVLVGNLHGCRTEILANIRGLDMQETASARDLEVSDVRPVDSLTRERREYEEMTNTERDEIDWSVVVMMKDPMHHQNCRTTSADLLLFLCSLLRVDSPQEIPASKEWHRSSSTFLLPGLPPHCLGPLHSTFDTCSTTFSDALDDSLVVVVLVTSLWQLLSNLGRLERAELAVFRGICKEDVKFQSRLWDTLRRPYGRRWW
ncbi:hypothetical protein BDN70DRAFT_968520 [Pholiota conissans]|uniref:Uncharacterized protein n=1 Tax=Pholiota conissans TaxID=109636 RepID=A0A9P5YNT3_9AGAR|nr:hypothetical protein BDN70DRAFT_968520 [Pholiota conissans]